ncbi:MAG: glycosyltransferase family 39 protein [Thermomicrobiales bacterium]|nr:glycosyltransferase family 39 protein [Thermomicrobiales bacterium]MCO5217424.1 glycosyltransferase family 39 protein [Thermomicrobiales bacterium]MCO5226042.1 glycosyltransferase family 39 protein [Thermomicrobiales bacterium]MCO5226728.1 glycosyltransferase family 39 protein [Thermomicrobiales bacterium]
MKVPGLRNLRRVLCDLPMQMVALAACTRLVLWMLAWHVGRLIPPVEDLGSPRSLTVWGNWDTWHYVTIANYGYDRSPDAVNSAFFPVYPGLLGIVRHLFGSHLQITDYRWVAVILSTLFLLIATWLLTVFYRQFASDDVAVLGVALFLVSPFSFFLSAGYTESLFIALTVAMFLLSRRRMWLAAAVVVAVATATRVTGVFLIPTLLYLAWQAGVQRRRLVGLVLISPLGLLSYMVWQWIELGSPFRFYTVQDHWGSYQDRTGMYLEALMNDPMGWIANDLSSPTLLLNIGIWLLWVATLVPMYRRFGPALTLFSGLIILQCMFFIVSQGRMLLPAIGVYITLAAMVTDRPQLPALKYGLLSVFLMAMVTLALLFANGQWIV